MKKLFICFLLASILFGTRKIYCQEALNKGVYSLAGNINYSSSSYSDNYSSIDSHLFTFAPQFVYFVGNHTSLGIVIDYTNNYSGFGTMSSISVGPSCRYYFYTEEIIPFLEADLNLTDPNLEGTSGLSIGIGIKGGFDYFLSKSVALEPSISYLHSSFSYSGSYNGSTVSNVFEVGIGINYYIFKEK